MQDLSLCHCQDDDGYYVVMEKVLGKDPGPDHSTESTLGCTWCQSAKHPLELERCLI